MAAPIFTVAEINQRTGREGKITYQIGLAANVAELPPGIAPPVSYSFEVDDPAQYPLGSDFILAPKPQS